MKEHATSCFGTRMAVVALTIALAAPVPANAQIGGLIKKAAGKVVDQHQDNPNARPSSAFGPELTEQTTTGVLKGLEAEQRILDQRDLVAQKRDALQDASNTLTAPHDAERQAFTSATGRWNECRNGVFDRLDQQQQARVAEQQKQLLSDPAKLAQFQKQIMAMQEKSMQLLQKGDTAGAMKLSQDFALSQSGLKIDPKADTAQAIKECGAIPVKPDWMVKAELDDAKADTLSTQVRNLEDKAQAAGVSASGLSAEQFAQARERLVNWYRGGKDNNSVQRFGKAELQLIHEHQAEIEKLERVL